MKILSTGIELGRVTGSQASVEFVIRVNLDGPVAECKVTGRVVGPRARGMTTVEVAYSLVQVEAIDNAVSLKCVIPEPSLWTRETPFSYGWSIWVEVDGKETNSRSGALAFQAPK
jgi:hypothetical protein